MTLTIETTSLRRDDPGAALAGQPHNTRDCAFRDAARQQIQEVH